MNSDKAMAITMTFHLALGLVTIVGMLSWLLLLQIARQSKNYNHLLLGK